jgi:hypothetical protein
MKRRNVPGVLLTAAVGPALIGAAAAREPPGLSRYAQTAIERRAGIEPVDEAYPPCTLLRYYRGAGDATEALQAAIDCAQLAGYGMVRMGAPGLQLPIQGPWKVDTNRTGIDFEGACIDASSITADRWCIPQQSATDLNERPMLNAAHPIMNACWRGPGAQRGSACALYINDSNLATYCIAGLMISNVGFCDWGQDVYLGDGAFCETFTGCTFGITVAGSSGGGDSYSVTQANAKNSGERNSFVACAWYNKLHFVQLLYGNSDMFFVDCSMDGDGVFIYNTAGTVVYLGGHMELIADSANAVYCKGPNAVVLIQGTEVVIDTDRRKFDIFYSDSTVSNGGICVDDIVLASGGRQLDTYLVGGDGMSRIGRVIQLANSSFPTLSRASSLLAYGGFESDAFAAEWTLSGAAGRSTAYARSGKWSMSLASTGDSTAAAVLTRTCAPGQCAQGELWYMFPRRSSGTLYGTLEFLDAGGRPLAGYGSVIMTVSDAFENWRRARFWIARPAPPGTVFVRMSIDLFGVLEGTETGYVDDVVLGLTA